MKEATQHAPGTTIDLPAYLTIYRLLPRSISGKRSRPASRHRGAVRSPESPREASAQVDGVVEGGELGRVVDGVDAMDEAVDDLGDEDEVGSRRSDVR